MGHRELIIALGVIFAASPVSATQPEQPLAAGAPAAPADARYCLRVDPITGTRLETIQCRTREEWAALEVDVDQEWADNGVRVIAGRAI
jgi:hypothetical protein